MHSLTRYFEKSYTSFRFTGPSCFIVYILTHKRSFLHRIIKELNNSYKIQLNLTIRSCNTGMAKFGYVAFCCTYRLAERSGPYSNGSIISRFLFYTNTFSEDKFGSTSHFLRFTWITAVNTPNCGDRSYAHASTMASFGWAPRLVSAGRLYCDRARDPLRRRDRPSLGLDSWRCVDWHQDWTIEK